METFIERKQKLCAIIDGYAALLDRLGGKYKTRKEEILSLRKNILKERYHIGLIGFVKRGKSTLLNALLGNKDNYNISPVRLLPCTAAIVKYLDSALHPDGEGKEGAIIYYNDGRNPEHIDKKDIPKFVDQKAEGFSEDNAKIIDCIEVYGSYPLIETRGIIVDTPGMGAVYDQDYLVEKILPDVDIILSPIAADFPLAHNEKGFIRDKLKKTEQEKLIFLLTKIDSDDIGESELQEVFSDVQNFAASILGGTPPVYKVAAKKVLDAYKAGKSDAEVIAVKEGCGIKALEEALDKKLREHSCAEENIRIARKTLEFYFDGNRKEWTEKKENLGLTSAELEQKMKILEEYCKITKSNYKKGTKELQQNWNKAINRFVSRLENKEPDILNRLNNEVNNKNLLSLIGYQKKMERKIQPMLQRELQVELDDLLNQLENIVIKFNEKLKSDIENDLAIYGNIPTSAVGDGIGTLFGGSIAVGGGLFGVTTTLGVLNSITTAIGASGAPIGFFPWLGKMLFGAGTGVKFTSGLVATLIGGIVPIVGGIGITALAYRIGTNIAKAHAEKRIPEMVEEQLHKAAESVENSAQKILVDIVAQFEDRLETDLEEKQAELDKTIEDVNALNAEAQIEETNRNLLELDKLTKDLISLSNAG